MSKIICYCSGGLGNRLKPLASCNIIANLTGRDLVVIWEPTLRCLAPFESLFDASNIQIMKEQELYNLKDVSVWCPSDAGDYEYNLNKLSGMKDIINKFGSKSIDIDRILEDTADNLIVFSNTFLPNISTQDHKEIFQHNLKPKNQIIKKANDIWTTLNLNENFIGVHARGTDFEDSGVNADYYLTRMGYLSNYSFFVCSDSPYYESYIKEKDGRNVVTRPNKIFVSKNTEGNWSNNVLTPTDSVQDSLVDIILLAKTDFRIYHPNSSFAHLVEMYKTN
jgi:hypothetical protein